MPPQTRASMIYFNTREKRSKLLGCPGNRGLEKLTWSLSVPKKSCKVCTIALLTQLCPEG